MKNKQIIESALISGRSIDDLIKERLKEEMKNVIKKITSKSEKKRIYNIKEVPSNQLFSKNAVFKKLNKRNNTISYINGIQAESLIGLDDITRKKLLSGEIDVFSGENCFIQFEYVEIICCN